MRIRQHHHPHGTILPATLLGSPLRIYIISNGGYLLSCSLALAGYFVYRQLRPDVPRPFRLPAAAKWGQPTRPT